MSATPPSPFAHLLKNSQQVLKDLQQAEINLYAKLATEEAKPKAEAAVGFEGLNVAVRGAENAAKDTPEPLLKLASLVKKQQQVMEDYDSVTSQKKAGMWQDSDTSLHLYSIIFDLYRPGPAFPSSHRLSSGALNAKIGSRDGTWDSVVDREAVAGWARHAVRLNNPEAGHRGSGTLMGDGRILTAGHVIKYPGWLFGQPPVQGHAASARFDMVPNVAAPGLELGISHFDLPGLLDFTCIAASPQWPDNLKGPFASLPGLQLQQEKMSDDQLRQCLVAVIGHPAYDPNVSETLQRKVYGDADFKAGFKRFMPGQFDPDAPTFKVSQGRLFLRHDCSTLGGASGACLVDLSTGLILGIHVSGVSATGEDRNRAVPAWLIYEALATGQPFA